MSVPTSGVGAEKLDERKVAALESIAASLQALAKDRTSANSWFKLISNNLATIAAKK